MSYVSSRPPWRNFQSGHRPPLPSVVIAPTKRFARHSASVGVDPLDGQAWKRFKREGQVFRATLILSAQDARAAFPERCKRGVNVRMDSANRIMTVKLPAVIRSRFWSSLPNCSLFLLKASQTFKTVQRHNDVGTPAGSTNKSYPEEELN